MFFRDQQHLVAGLEFYLDSLDSPGNEPCPSLQDAPRQVHRNLLSGRTGKGDTGKYKVD